MVAMPYFLVNIALDIFSSVLFCTTSVTLLFRSRFASRWLPSQLSRRKTLTLIVTQGLVLSVLSIVAMGVVRRLRYVELFSLTLFDVFFFIGAANAAVWSTSS